jgi:hypothetical protein
VGDAQLQQSDSPAHPFPQTMATMLLFAGRTLWMEPEFVHGPAWKSA